MKLFPDEQQTRSLRQDVRKWRA